MKISAPDLQRIHRLFTGLGCSSRDIDLYLVLLEQGAVSIQELAKTTKQNRVTVHSSIQRLIDRGFVYETRKGKRRLVVAENPLALHQLLQRKESELALMRTSMDYVTNVLSRFHHHTEDRPSVKFYEDVDGIKRMLEESLKTEKKEIYVFSFVDSLAGLLDPDYLERYFARRAKKDISTRLIFSPCPFAERVQAKARQYKIQIRYLPPQLEWKAGIFSWDTTVAIMSYTEGKVTCTIIENEDIAVFYQKVIFELCWSQATP